MKKVKNLLLILTVIALLPLSVFAKDKVNVYLFKKQGCSHCANALAFFNNLDEEYQSYFNLVTKELQNNETNNELLKKTINYFKVNLTGVPFIVIGEQTFEGYSEKFDEQIKEAIKNAYENESRDVVASLMEDKTNESAITIIILIAVVFGVIFLVRMAKDNNEEEPKKEVVSKKKTTTKKKTNKK